MSWRTPDWLEQHRKKGGYRQAFAPWVSTATAHVGPLHEEFLADVAFNRHSMNDGSHVSPYDTGRIDIGLDHLEVRLLQGVDETAFRNVVSRATRATTGLPVPVSGENLEDDWKEMMGGGLQAALETQTIVFEVWGASRALTHQLVRSRKAGFHQQSQRATWYGDRPEVRMPESIWRANGKVRQLWLEAIEASWAAYRAACEADISYQDARYILPEGTVNYIQCEYTIREFLNVYAYRACSMFLWEMVAAMRSMKAALLAAHPMFDPYVKISCEKGPGCEACSGTGSLGSHEGGAFHSIVCNSCGGTGGRKCTFQGWENVEGQCSFPWARQDNRTFLPTPKYRIGAK